MTSRQLSPDIVSLIHHVELNESGWWKKGVSQIVKGVLWKSQTPMTISELKQAIRRETGGGVPLADDELAKQLTSLSEIGIVSMLPDSKYKLTERAFKELTVSHAEAQEEQHACRGFFEAACAEHCPNLDADQAWGHFTSALSKAIRVSGANLFRLLIGGSLRKDFDWLEDFFTRIDSEHREGLRQVLMSFFDPENQVCRNQILRFMTAYFFAEATHLQPETLSAINQARKVRSIKVVLDTNFLFSVLQLHDNPADDAALALVDLAQKSHGKLEIKLYVLPSTLEEAKRVLMAQLHLVEQVRTTQALARAALSQSLPSIAKKFFATAAKNPGLSAQIFFRPYIEDLRHILNEKGIAVLEAHPSVYHMRQDVIDDVMTEVKREEAEPPEKRRKGYETLLHDAVLWHAVNDRRLINGDSPFEVEYWAVSIDWRLINFDRAKRSANGATLPVVLHPTNLVQLIQFWVPRTPELEESLVDALRLPLFFQSFDPEDERATMKVLESLSRFQNIDDLPETTIRVVLANQALRSRLKSHEASNEEAFELVRDELLGLNKDLVGKLEEAKGGIDQRDQMLGQEREARQSAESQNQAMAQRVQDIESERQQAELKAQQAEQKQAALAVQLQKGAITSQAEIETQRERADAAERTLERAKFFGLFLFAPILAGVGLYSLAGHFEVPQALGLTNDWGVRSIKLLLLLLPITVAVCLSSGHTSKRPYLQSWRVSRWCSFVGKKIIIAPALMGLEAIYAGGLWDGIKAIFQIGN
ncbi:hypothetical protein [Pseudomonas nitroreducens]|uniref:hypothetical protein n=1 Tax=Pseudomonas nitroreducens TaxID=46680 RepID=UPI001876A254|nr:hypothetical protein [Pseudomonas nitritireducens]